MANTGATVQSPATGAVVNVVGLVAGDDIVNDVIEGAQSQW